MKKKSITRTATLSAYGPVDYGCGHTITGFFKQLDKERYYRMSVVESLTFFEDMLDQFKSVRLGSKIKVTMELVD